jgi:hypothetical protein
MIFLPFLAQWPTFSMNILNGKTVLIKWTVFFLLKSMKSVPFGTTQENIDPAPLNFG